MADLGRSQDDPRAGGEDRHYDDWDDGTSGRSPRGRGGRRGGADRAQRNGTIPARAGRTHPVAVSAADQQDDPRAGGEDRMGLNAEEIHAGRSPRGRGGLRRHRRAGAWPRTIPARAGRTCPRSSRPNNLPDDPRAGGEDRFKAATDSEFWGRSPRGRGGLPAQTRQQSASRTIPARAGRTHCPRWAARSVADDPRAGGEDAPGPGLIPACEGRSPRGRGGLMPRPSRRPRRGTIPARAGRTLAVGRPWITWRTIPARAGRTSRPSDAAT